MVVRTLELCAIRVRILHHAIAGAQGACGARAEHLIGELDRAVVGSVKNGEGRDPS